MSRWWEGEAGISGSVADASLLPLEHLYGLGMRSRTLAYHRRYLTAARAPLPVVSIGNIEVGGAGKTPFTAWVASRLLDWGSSPGIVTGGYAEDEILLHRELNPRVPVFSSKVRVRAAEAAAAAGCELVILDDAFQHLALARDLDIVLVAAESWVSRRRLLPRGPWRESAAALRRAHLVVLTAKSVGAERLEHVRQDISTSTGHLPIVVCRIRPSTLSALAGGVRVPIEMLRSERVLAVTGIARPQPFADHLLDAGAHVELVAYPDHHRYTADEVKFLRRRAGTRCIVTTRKDAVKLRPLLSSSENAFILDQQLELLSGAHRLESELRRVASLELK